MTEHSDTTREKHRRETAPNNASERITVRVTPDVEEKIDAVVEDEQTPPATKSQLIRTAINRYLDRSEIRDDFSPPEVPE